MADSLKLGDKIDDFSAATQKQLTEAGWCCQAQCHGVGHIGPPFFGPIRKNCADADADAAAHQAGCPGQAAVWIVGCA
jgi:hypothetical protein